MSKRTLPQRLNIIKGQIDGLSKLIEDNENCRKVTEQFYAINSGLKKVIELYLKENLNSCLRSMDNRKKKVVDFLLKEIIKSK
ncbi:MAG TPA: metal-sensitive transcriptional regulator [Candidatus Portnoybacteria bacterium]|nr:metal-sensitive transcriptional regulator [Candidatus Portnoybacteria bacterium]